MCHILKFWIFYPYPYPRQNLDIISDLISEFWKGYRSDPISDPLSKVMHAWSKPNRGVIWSFPIVLTGSSQLLFERLHLLLMFLQTYNLFPNMNSCFADHHYYRGTPGSDISNFFLKRIYIRSSIQISKRIGFPIIYPQNGYISGYIYPRIAIRHISGI